MDEVLTAADVSSSFRSNSSPSYLSPPNLPLLSAFLSFALAQFLKLFTTWYKEKRWDTRRLLGSGGMPSSHSATVTAIALQEGTGGSAFAIAVILASVVMYDATGVRLHAGRQAELLNQIVCDLPPEHRLKCQTTERFTRSHSPTGSSWCRPAMYNSIPHDKLRLKLHALHAWLPSPFTSLMIAYCSCSEFRSHRQLRLYGTNHLFKQQIVCTTAVPAKFKLSSKDNLTIKVPDASKPVDTVAVLLN